MRKQGTKPSASKALLESLMLLVFFVGLAATHSSCYREPLVDPIEAGYFELVVVPRWMELDARPTGMTVMIYPTDGAEPIELTTNNVDSLTTFLAPGNYKILCFNQTQSEFSSFRFRHMESFADCEIVANEDPGHRNAFSIFGNSQMSIQPELLVVDYYTGLSVSQEEIDDSYRHGKKLKKVVTLSPHLVVSTLYVTVPVQGIYNAYSVSGCIDGLARNLFLTYFDAGKDRASHVISNWAPHYESVSSNHGSLTSVSTTLGLPGMPLHLTATGYEETREELLDYLKPTKGTGPNFADPEFEEEDIKLHMKVMLKDLKTVVDTTYNVGTRIHRRSNYQLILDLKVDDLFLPYVKPADGSSTAAFDVDFDDWNYEDYEVSF